jgi:hypothetical protein
MTFSDTPVRLGALVSVLALLAAVVACVAVATRPRWKRSPGRTLRGSSTWPPDGPGPVQEADSVEPVRTAG